MWMSGDACVKKKCECLACVFFFIQTVYWYVLIMCECVKSFVTDEWWVTCDLYDDMYY